MSEQSIEESSPAASVAHADFDTDSRSLDPFIVTLPSSFRNSSTSESRSQIQNIKEIISRIRHEKIPYIGIYKPGELGRETWRAVVPSPRRRGKGRGVRGQWESIVLSTPTRGEIGKLIEEVKQIDEDVGVRHIINPHCNQDEGMRIVWPGRNEGEMRDWTRRDRMIRDGRTVKALVRIKHGYEDQGMYMEAFPMFMGPVPVWDNIGWTRLC